MSIMIKKKQIIKKVMSIVPIHDLVEFVTSNEKKNNSDSDSGSFGSESESSIDLYNPHVSIKTIESIAGIKVNNPDIYRRALVHKSIQKLVKRAEYPDKVLDYLKESNERLEFLGDSVLGSTVALYLYNKYPDKDEGMLTKYRTRIVKSSTLSYFAKKIGIQGNILMTNQVKSMNGMDNNRFLEDAFESFIGAMRLDFGVHGTVVCEKFIIKIIDSFMDESKILKDDNYKDLLLRYTQYIKTAAPVYNVIDESGQPHERNFTIEIVLFDKVQGSGKAKTKKAAEQLASLEAIKRLDIKDDFN
jgi:ribonuclease-3